MNAIEIKGLCKSYKDFKIDNIDLTLPGGCVIGLIGENGAGKSTTIKLILNIAFKDSGTIKILGKDNEKELDLVKEDIELYRTADSILYTAVNTNKLRYLDKFDCIWPKKMKICILLLRDGDKWILYGIGGVNAPRVPFFTERIQTSFINRINTFCSFIFKKF